MNSKMLKYNFKEMALFAYYFLGITIVFRILFGSANGDWTEIFIKDNDLEQFSMLFLALIVVRIFSFMIGIDKSDVYFSLPILKKKQFDFAVLQSFILGSGPILILIIINVAMYVNQGFAIDFTQIMYSTGIILLITFFLIALLSFFLTISANKNMSILMVILSLGICGSIYWKFRTIGLPTGKFAEMTVLSLVLILVARKSFEYRLAEKVGDLLMFRWAEIGLAGIIAGIVGIGILMSGGLFNGAGINIGGLNLGLASVVVSLIFTVIVYILAEGYFVKEISLKRVVRQKVNLVVPILIYVLMLAYLVAYI